MNAPIPRERLERFLRLTAEVRRREARKQQARRGGLIEFVRHFWPVLEPQTPLVDGWPLEAICAHLEAVTFGEVNRLLVNVPPGFMKSLLTDVFWPAWEWGPMDMPHLRYVAFSYSVGLTERDNGKFRDLLLSREYQDLWGHRFGLRKVGEVKVSNDKTGSKLATSVGGIGTGERGDRVIVDDPHNIKDGESDVIRAETVRWFRESLSNRLNDLDQSAIVVIMQRVHEDDVSGTVLAQDFGYEHLMIPMEFEPGRGCTTSIGWTDPRSEEGELAWPERFTAGQVEQIKVQVGPYAYAAQYRQMPEPRGGGIIKREFWQPWEEAKFPAFDFVLASADTAYTEKEENDPTGFTIWGVWRHSVTKLPQIMLVWAWRKHLALHGPAVDRLPGETQTAYDRRAMPSWGLVEWIAYSCRKYKVDRLLIESKASGISAAQELQRLHGTEGWAIHLEQVSGDKVARAHAVQPVWSQGLVWAPERQWADLVIDEMAVFPKGRRKDLTDSATQAVRHLRDCGFITHRHEQAFEEYEAARHRPRPAPLYPV